MLKKITLITLAMIITFIIPSMILAADLDITKTAPSEIKYGENLQVTITLKNNLNQQVLLTIREVIGDAEAISPQLIVPNIPTDIIAARPPYFEWELTLNANSQESIDYTIKPNKVGDYLFSPTSATTSDGKIFYSDVISTLVRCSVNNICEESMGEDFTNCPEDCKPPASALQPAPIYIVVIIILVVCIIAIILFIKKKLKRKKSKKIERKKSN